MKCFNCGFENSDNASFCGNCGNKLAQENVADNQANLNSNTDNASNYVPQNPTPNEYNYNYPNTQTGNFAPPYGKKPKKFPKVLLVILGVIVALALAFILLYNFCAPFKNVIQGFGSPKDDFKSHVSDNISDAVDGLVDIFNLEKDDKEDFNKKSVSTDVKFTLGDSLISIFEAFGDSSEIGAVLDLLNDTGINFDISTYDELLHVSVSLDFGTIIKAEAVINTETGEIFFRLPDASSDWASIAIDDYNAAVLASNFESINIVSDVLERFLIKHTAIVIDGISNIERTKEDITLGDVTEKNTKRFTFKITKEEMFNIINEILTSLKTDKDFEILANEIIGIMSGLEDISFDDVLYSIDDAIEYNDVYDYEGIENIEFSLWFDNDGDLTGFNADYKDGDFSESVGFKSVEAKGGKIASSFVVDMEDWKIELSGEGTKIKDKLTADFHLTVDESLLLNINVENLDDESGKITVTPGTALYDIIGFEYSSFISNAAIVIDYNFDEDRACNFDVELKLGNETFFKLDTDSTVSDLKAKPELPSSAYDIDDPDEAEAWTQSIAMYLISEILPMLSSIIG